MNDNLHIQESESRDPKQPRVFAIVYLGGGSYALDLIEEGGGPRRLCQGRSVVAMRRQLAKVQRHRDILLMSEALRALELTVVPVKRLRQRAAKGAPDGFLTLKTLEALSPPTPRAAPRAARAPRFGVPLSWTIAISCNKSFPQGRLDGLLDFDLPNTDSEDRGADDNGPGLN